MGVRKVPLAIGIVAGIGLFGVCILQLLAGVINMAVIFGVAGVAAMEFAVMIAVIKGKPTPMMSAGQMQMAGQGAINAKSGPTEFTMLSPQPSMGHMDLRMDTASSSKENTGIYIESEDLMRGGSLQKLVYGVKEEKKPKKAPAKKIEAKRPAKLAKTKSK